MAKEILIIKHIDIEGPGSMEEFFQNTAWSLKTIDLSKQDLGSEDFSSLVAIVSLGGPMNVYEENKYPFLQDEDEFLKKAIKEEIPILGICLGSQLLAKACGAKVKKALQKEIGWYKINLTEAAVEDMLFQNLPRQLEAFQWHEDTFEIPKGAQLLVKGNPCPNQAFRFGRNAYGLQFHIEVTPKMVESWINEYREESLRPEIKDMLVETNKREEFFRKQAEIIYLNFARIIEAAQKVGVE